ncbi:FAD-binding oxidoreductase [Kitasatospora sp. NPDC057015]|uniref:FAD-binding oxidoreductase n=1 Tax=Kitasatospora sp. NPDC057015 TaxID=3346001 RepID=UPI003635A104
MAGITIDDLRERTRGAVITPGDSDYDEARKVYNATADRRPAAVVRCANAGDVMAVVNHARESGLELAVRGGGHSAPGFGTCDDGLVADLSGLRGVRVDPANLTARADPGATWGDFNAATHAFGLATTGGIISTTGIAGLTLGGGFGYLCRSMGMTCDNLLSADVVTADGRFLTTDAQQHPDLFWALRGGGGNFGVVTSFEYRLAPVDTVVAGPMLFELDQMEGILRFYREFAEDAPEQLFLFPGFQTAPPLPFIPEDRHGDVLGIVVVCWSGPAEQADAVLRPLRDLAPRVAEAVGPMPYPAINAAFDALLPPGLREYWKGSFATELTDGVIAAHLEHGPKVPSLSSTVHIYPVTGAPQRVAPDATAYAYREASFSTVILGVCDDPSDDAASTAWVRDYYAAVSPHSEPGGYVNFMSADDGDRVEVNYRGNYDRLAAVKRTYDPDNLFHLNQNIRPAAA